MAFQLDNLRAARFTGPDAADFLHAQLSADVQSLDSGESTFACYCSPKGQVIALLLVCRADDCFLVAADRELLPAVLQRLGLFVLRSQVEFSPNSGVCVYGLDETRDQPESLQVFRPREQDLDYAFAASIEGAASDSREWKVRELARGIIWLSAATSGKFIPQMLGFETIGAVSFSKGCYPGQEIVARAKYLGRVKRKPRLLIVEEALSVAAGTAVELSSDSVTTEGIVADSVCSAQGHSLLFTVARFDDDQPVITLGLDGRSYRCATT